MGKVRDLTYESQKKLIEHTLYWDSYKHNNPSVYKDEVLNKDVNDKLEVYVSGNRSLAEYYLHFAILECDLDLIDDLLEHGADPNALDEKWTKATPLQLAASNGRAAIIEKLLAKGANPENIEIKYSMNPCAQPLTFLWGVKELINGREVDYEKVNDLCNESSKYKMKYL